jgi:hypothetical protein
MESLTLLVQSRPQGTYNKCMTEQVHQFNIKRPLKRGSIYMNFSMSGQEKGDPLIQVTT